jgi:hypothetical protein
MKRRNKILMIPYIFLVMAKVNVPLQGKEPSGHTSSQIDQGCPHTEEFFQGMWIKQYNGMGPVCIRDASPRRRILGSTSYNNSFKKKANRGKTVI